MRTTISGRFPSVVSNLTRADDTMDSRISANMDMMTCPGPAMEIDDDPTYSSIPDNIFGTPQSFQYVLYKPRLDQNSIYGSPASNTLPAPVQRCESTPNPIRHLSGMKSKLTIEDCSYRNSLSRIQHKTDVMEGLLESKPQLLKNSCVSINTLGLPPKTEDGTISMLYSKNFSTVQDLLCIY